MIQKTSPKLSASRETFARTSRPAKRPAAATLIRQMAYDKIKHQIITCAFRPGEYINELQLSTALKLGRTPVRQALNHLRIEGMVDVIPRKGVIVRPVSLKEILQIIDVRLINEPVGARLAAERANDTDINDLADILRRTKHSASVRNIEDLMLLDREFHLLVARMANNDVPAAELLRTLHERSLRFWFISAQCAHADRGGTQGALCNLRGDSRP